MSRTKNTVTEIKNVLHGLISGLERHSKVSELGNISIESLKTERQKKKENECISIVRQL